MSWENIQPAWRRLWLYVPKDEKAYLALAKAGSSSLYQWLSVRTGHAVQRPQDIRFGHEPDVVSMSPDQVAKLPDTVERVAIIRDPVERFVSLVKDKTRPGQMERLRGLSPQRVALAIGQDPWGDIHWVPHSAIEQGMADTLIPLDQIQEYDPLFPCINRVDRTLDTKWDYETWVKQHYDDDVELYEKAKRCFND